MENLITKKRRLILVSVLLCFSLLSCYIFTSCKKSNPPYSLMLEFCESYGISDTVFSPSLKEWEQGYADEVFFETVFGDNSSSVSDYAIVFLSSLDIVGECVIFLCYSDYDALIACDILRGRVEILKSMGTGMDTSYLDDAAVFKSGRYAVMCALSDNERAERIWRKIL